MAARPAPARLVPVAAFVVAVAVGGCHDDKAPCADGRCRETVPLVIDSFDATPPAIRQGERATLVWSTRGAAACDIAPGHPVVPRSGSLEVSPAADQRYTLSCAGSGGERKTAEANVSLIPGGVVDGGGPDGGGQRDDAGFDDGGAGPDDGGAELDDAGHPLADASVPLDGGLEPVDAGPRRGPRHRWSFGGETNGVVEDTIGGAHGQVFGGASFDGEGGLSLDGVDGYVDLPNGLLSVLGAVTVEAWVVWDGDDGGDWQRIFDCGTTSVGEIVGVGDSSSYDAELSTFLQLSPKTQYGTVRATVNDGIGDAYGYVEGAAPLPSGEPAHVALVYAPASADARLYVDGVEVGSAALTWPLSSIDDVNCWLGRSNYSVDPGFDGTLLEVRLYGRALSNEEVEASFLAGPDVLWSE